MNIIRNALFMHSGCFTRGSVPCIWHRNHPETQADSFTATLSFLLSLSFSLSLTLSLLQYRSCSLSLSLSFSLVVSVSMQKVRCACIHRDAMPWLGTARKQFARRQQISVITSYARMIYAKKER